MEATLLKVAAVVRNERGYDGTGMDAPVAVLDEVSGPDVTAPGRLRGTSCDAVSRSWSPS